MMNCGSSAVNSTLSLINATYVMLVRFMECLTPNLDGAPPSKRLPVFITTPCSGFGTMATHVSSKFTRNATLPSFLALRK